MTRRPRPFLRRRSEPRSNPGFSTYHYLPKTPQPTSASSILHSLISEIPKEDRADTIGESMYICAERPTVAEMAQDLSKVLKVQVETLGLTKEEFYSQEHREEVGEAMWSQYRACYEQ